MGANSMGMGKAKKCANSLAWHMICQIKIHENDAKKMLFYSKIWYWARRKVISQTKV